MELHNNRESPSFEYHRNLNIYSIYLYSGTAGFVRTLNTLDFYSRTVYH